MTRIIRFSEKIGQQLCGFRRGAATRNNKARTRRACYQPQNLWQQASMRKAHALIQPEKDVEVLYRLTRRAFDQVVDD